MATSGQDGPQPIASQPNVVSRDSEADAGAEAEMAELSSASSSGSGSESGEDRPTRRSQRPKLLTRKSSGTIIVSRDNPNIEVQHEDYAEGDARAMSPRRSSEEVDRLGEAARRALIDQARQLQASLLSIVDRVEIVKNDHEKLEGGNKFLQSYIGELMQTSKITSTSSSKSKGKARATR